MTPPYTPAPGYPPPPPQPSGGDKVTLFGVLGLVIGVLCCSPAGIVLGVLSMNEAKKVGKPTTLGLAAIIVSSVSLVLGLIWTVIRVSSS